MCHPRLPVAGLQPPTSGHRPLGATCRPGLSPQTKLSRAATETQLFMGRLGVLPRPALPSALLRSGGQAGKSSQSKVGHISHSSKYAWSTCWMPGPQPGLHSGVREGPRPLVSPGTMPAEAPAGLGQERNQSPDSRILSLPLLFLPLLSLPPAASPWLHPFSSSIPPTLPCSPWLFTGGSLLPVRSRC